MRGTKYPGSNNWERQSCVDLFDQDHVTQFTDVSRIRRYERIDLNPGEILSIPSDWLHEVHTSTDSISLGWRYSLQGGGGETLSAKLERQANLFQKGMDPSVLLADAMKDPELRKYFNDHGGF
eukprot:TRINITY_DN8578_c0_g1_i1.p1 TRINITY_DN8578_c0_g1~~TRINITY_DN8578_c0_g1_i1.p1  ORF type:complete len:123 (-),score=2.97 TRINITY_DN8578_c0_g1_i1:45-413(-)